MFEHKTFENILGEMLSNVVAQNPTVDTRTGSIIYTALAPIALELETAYHEMDMILDETFLETASKEYLIQHAKQMGLELEAATCGHFKGEFDVAVAIGSRFNFDKFNYTVIANLSNPDESNPYYTCELVCETSGVEPNDYLGDLTPITYIEKLSYAKLTEILIYGEDEEDTEAFRYRLLAHARNTAVDGNVYQYDEWLNNYPSGGIGKYKIFPCWNGVNTVKLLILNTNNTSASTELIEDVQNYFDPPTETINDDVEGETYPQGRGMGDGKAPIGAIVTVGTATEIPVVVECSVQLKDGYHEVTGVAEAVNDYLKSIVFTTQQISSYAIVAAMYKAECVLNISDLSISIGGNTLELGQSVELASDEIAVLDQSNSSIMGG